MNTLLPKEIILETTNHCNLKCRFCHFHGPGSSPSRSKGHMKRALWQKIVAELAEFEEETVLCLHGAGEPLLYPDLKNLIEKVKENPSLKVGFMTNAMLLDKAWSDYLLDVGIDWLAFSVDGVDPETNDFFRRGASLTKVEENIYYLINAKERRRSPGPALSFNMVAYPETEDQAETYVKKWLPHAAYVSISRFRPIGSRVLFDKVEAPMPRFRPCPLLYSQLVISWDGRAGLCCEDIFVDVQLGDANKETLKTIFNTGLIHHYRAFQEQGRKGELALCNECDVWAGSLVLWEKELDIDGCPTICQETWAGRLYKPAHRDGAEQR